MSLRRLPPTCPAIRLPTESKRIRGALPQLLSGGLLFPLMAAALPGDPIGSPFLPGTLPARANTLVATGMSALGAGVVVHDRPRDAECSENVIVARLLAPDGTLMPAEIEVATDALCDTFSTVNAPTVAMAPDGRFIVVWYRRTPEPAVMARRYLASGVAEGDAFQISRDTHFYSFGPSVAVQPSGAFAVAWDGPSNGDEQNPQPGDIRFRGYNASGLPSTPEIVLTGGRHSVEFAPSVALDATGRAVVTWTATSTGTPDNTVAADAHAQFLDSSGVPVGPVVTLDKADKPSAFLARAAMTPAGQVAITWSTGDLSASPAVADVMIRRHSPSGSPLGDAQQVNEIPGGYQLLAPVAVDADGDAFVSWTAYDSNFNRSARGRRYDAQGVPTSGDFAIGGNAARLTSVAADADGDHHFVWLEPTTADENAFRLVGQRHVGPEPVDLSIAIAASPAVVAPGDEVRYRLTVGNAHAVSGLTGIPTIDAAIGAATGGRISITVPVGAAVVDAGGTGWQCASDPGGILQCTADAPLLASTQSGTDLVLTAPAQEGSLALAAAVSGQQHDPTPANNRDQASTSVSTAAGRDPCATAVATTGCTVNGVAGQRCVGSASTDDVILGTSRDDVILDSGGRNRILGGHGNDLICGGDGPDDLRGDNGRDRLHGGGGDDSLAGGNGDDELVGGPGNDRGDGDRGSDRCELEAAINCERR